jgi:hypothetical protein
MENLFLSFMVGVLHRTIIYVNLNNYNYIKVEPLIPHTFMISLGYKSQHAFCLQDLDMFCPQDLSSLKYIAPSYYHNFTHSCLCCWVYLPSFLEQFSLIFTHNHPFISHFLVVKSTNHFSPVIIIPMTISITLFDIISNNHLEIYTFIHSITSSC